MTEQATEAVLVIQADRDAAADWMSTQSYDWGFCGDVRSDRVEHDLPIAFAKHRIAHTPPSTGEAVMREAAAKVAERIVNDLCGRDWPAKVEEVARLIERTDTRFDEFDELKSKLRCVISHATGGGCMDIDLPLNEISVRISKHHNRIWEAAQESAKAKTPDTRSDIIRELVEALEPFADACTISNAADHEDIDDTIAATKITWADLRKAKRTLAKVQP
jgi:hypothetical protein